MAGIEAWRQKSKKAAEWGWGAGKGPQSMCTAVAGTKDRRQKAEGKREDMPESGPRIERMSSEGSGDSQVKERKRRRRMGGKCG